MNNPEPSGISRRGLLTGALAAALGVGLVGCGKKEKRALPHTTQDLTVLLVRHAEKPDEDNQGIDDDGRPDSESLARRGWDRAKALPTLFTGGHPLLPRPVKIYGAAPDGPDGGSNRTRQTVTPLATALGLTVDTSYAKGQERELAAAAEREPQPVLICWEHQLLSKIIDDLGAASAPGVPKKWPSDRYDMVWALTRTNGAWAFKEVNEHLLTGDA